MFTFITVNSEQKANRIVESLRVNKRYACYDVLVSLREHKNNRKPFAVPTVPFNQYVVWYYTK